MRRLLPAHTREAKDMAKRLKEALCALDLGLNCLDPESQPPTLQQTQELMAKAMGYEGGWKELSAETAKPHTPVYIDGLDDDDDEDDGLFEEGAERLAKLLGFDYLHGVVWNAWSNAAIGYSPRWRRRMDELATPWGLICEQEEVVPGILSVSTGGHGGLVLSAERQQQVPSHLRLDTLHYEEDCDWALVVLAFPGEFPDRIASALGSVGVITSISVPRVREVLDERYEKLLSECQIGYVPPERDPMNRNATTDEQEVIEYLARCVLTNQRPVRIPGETSYPSLQDWVLTLSAGPRVDGTWPMLAGPWRAHWGQWQRMAEDDARREEYEQRVIAEWTARSRETDPDATSQDLDRP